MSTIGLDDGWIPDTTAEADSTMVMAESSGIAGMVVVAVVLGAWAGFLYAMREEIGVQLA